VLFVEVGSGRVYFLGGVFRRTVSGVEFPMNAENNPAVNTGYSQAYKSKAFNLVTLRLATIL
jgi:hypothetical protein